MEILRISASVRGAVIYYPVFPCGWERANLFYLRLADEAKNAAEVLDGMRYYADFKAEEKDGCVSVTYAIKAKRNGRTEKSKSFCHIWRDGRLIKAIKPHK